MVVMNKAGRPSIKARGLIGRTESGMKVDAEAACVRHGLALPGFPSCFSDSRLSTPITQPTWIGSTLPLCIDHYSRFDPL